MCKAWRGALRGIVLGALLCGSAFAQQPQAPEIQRYRQEIQECSRIVSNWQWEANVQISFVISVIVFGALITIFQGMNKGWCKPATLVLGAFVTILTSINAKVFSADYRILQQSVIDGKDLIEQLNGIIDNLNLPQTDVPGLENQWVKTKTQFSGLQKAVLQGASKTAALHIWAKTVNAQSTAPTWVNRPPIDDYNLYFVGMAEDRSIEVARQGSFDNAVANGVAKLSSDKTTDVEALRRVIASSSAVDKSSFVFDKGKGVYLYYTLLRISSDIKNLSFKGGQSENSKSVVVSGQTRWTDTGIQVRKGDKISFAATGQVQWAVGEVVGPEGSPRKRRAAALRPAYPVSSIGAGGLIARIGSGPGFAVGKAANIVANETGTLFVGINDNSFKDNSGQFSVSIVWVSSQ